MQGYVGPLIVAQVDGPALTNTTTATSILPAQAKYTMGAGFIDTIGKEFRLRASGRISTVVTTPGTLTLDVRFGSVVVTASSAMVLSTTAKTNVTWELDLSLTARSVSTATAAAATMLGIGSWKSEAAGASTTAGEAKVIMWPTSAPAVGSAFDSTAAFVVDLFGTWSVASASNSITLHKYLLESIN